MATPVPVELTVLPSKPGAALAFLVVGGPILVFPDFLPVSWRTDVVTLVTLAAIGLGLVMLHPWKPFRLGLRLFLLAVVASWAVMPVHDLSGLRHFAGIGAGVLGMAAVATWCRTTDRLVTATLLFALVATGILSVGFLGTHLPKGKLLVDASQVFEQTPSATYDVEKYLYPWKPNVQLELPGLEGNAGWVNANALGGTALMLLPTCGGLAAAAFLSRRRRYLMALAGGVATTVAVTVVGMVQSRVALLAAALTLIVLSLRWRRGRRWVLLALLLATVGVACAAVQSRAAAPANFALGIERTRMNVLARVAIWQDGVDQLMESPWLGIGISQFHEIGRAQDLGGETHVAHAHNTLLQVALDVGLLGLAGYVLLMGTLLLKADRAARIPGIAGRVAGGAGLSLVGLHLFGLGDAIALGAKVGLFQWLCAGLILAVSHLPPLAREGRVAEGAP